MTSATAGNSLSCIAKSAVTLGNRWFFYAWIRRQSPPSPISDRSGRSTILSRAIRSAWAGSAREKSYSALVPKRWGFSRQCLPPLLANDQVLRARTLFQLRTLSRSCPRLGRPTRTKCSCARERLVLSPGAPRARARFDLALGSTLLSGWLHRRGDSSHASDFKRHCELARRGATPLLCGQLWATCNPTTKARPCSRRVFSGWPVHIHVDMPRPDHENTKPLTPDELCHHALEIPYWRLGYEGVAMSTQL